MKNFLSRRKKHKVASKSKEDEKKLCKSFCCGSRPSTVSSSSGGIKSSDTEQMDCLSSFAHGLVHARLEQMVNEEEDTTNFAHQRPRGGRRDQCGDLEEDGSSGGGRRFIVLMAMETSSDDPKGDFRRSMTEVIMARRLQEPRELRSLLNCYMSVNSRETRLVILEAFYEIERTRREVEKVFDYWKMWIVFLLSLILFAGAPASALYSPSSPVLQLTPSNFKSKVLNSDGVVLVEFFAPWCGHCQALSPTWEKAAKVLKGVATVAALDCDDHKALAQEYGIRGFPTIKVFMPGQPPVDYQGAREVKPIAEFAVKQVKALLKGRLEGKYSGSSKEKSEPNASVELNSRNFDERVLNSKDLWIVEFFAPWCGHCKKLAPDWKKAASNLKGKVMLGHVDCDAEKSLMSRFNVQGFPTILVFGSDKDSPYPFEGARTASAIESFALELLETNVAPPEVTELTGPDVMEEKCASAAICFVAFLPDILDSKAEGRNKYLDLLLSVAEKFKRSPYSYVWAGAGKQADLEKHVGVGGYGYPALVALNVKKGAYAPLRSAFQLDPINEFIKEAGRGGKGNLPLENTPVVVQTEPWDGKDGEVIEEYEFSLEELMGEDDDKSTKDEL